MAKRFIQNNFYTFAAGSLTLSMVSGWVCLSFIQDQHKKQHGGLLKHHRASVLGDTSSRTKGPEELRLQAMVENALKSSWQENVNNAVDAQQRFMLPGRNHGEDPTFVKKIERRADELLKKQNRRRERRRRKLAARENDESSSSSSSHEPPLSDQEDKQQTKMQFWK